MFAEERKAKIIDKLKNTGSVKVASLSKQFNVSEATIRRDLQELENKGLLSRSHGGAVLLEHTKFEPTFTEKESKFSDEKSRIGKKAASLIEEGDTIVIDSGTTTSYIVNNIEAKNITIVTNSLYVLNELGKREDIDVIGVGGSIKQKTQAFVGPLAEATLKKLRVDKAFIGANGICYDNGITTPDIIECKIKSTMIEIAREVILVSDSSKFGKVTFSKIADIEEIDLIITDNKISNEQITQYGKRGVRIETT
ncbi:DeoR/GlpR family DNA-binding transcription regulator [Caldisalinibacter kiritimatiensis]|uniref:Putative regulator of fructose utilization, DeoR family n=1 Tax=Caldisalinibacter kiritimatiensis TaxID=1304284 RepID=R1CVD5_9FIRM|nr:DeoR/GlpR family DNA-binding transcription regulator [Caldisalinibacter kiritimatiensis]EOD00604.1 Putative regulator of fructose utilization, DeoR family [Caldisalinibacter kiritimatiensis]